MYCKNCDIDIQRDDLKVCPYCGSALIELEYSRDFSDIEDIPVNNIYDETDEEFYEEDYDNGENFNEEFDENFDDEYFPEDYEVKKPKKEKEPMDPKRKKIMITVFVILGVLLVGIGALAVFFKINGETVGPTKTTFVGTTEPQVDLSVNSIGNSVGNMVNRGLAAEQDGYIYYVVKEIDYTKKKEEQMSGSGIYRMRADGNEKTLICNANAEFLNVVGDYIYFSNVDSKVFCRINTDGSNLRTLYPHDISYVTVTNDYIYFIDNDTFSFNRMTLEATGVERLIEDSVAFYTIVGDQIFYKLNVEDSTMNVCDIEGQNPLTLDSTFYGVPLIKDKDNIYCNNSASTIYRTNSDATENTVLFDGLLTGGVTVTDTNIYLSGGTVEEGQIQKLDLIGTNGIVIYPRDAKYINVAGDFLFCLDKDDMTYVIRNDGTGFEELSKPRDKKSEAYIRSLIENEVTDEILSFNCFDYDVSGDKSLEAFAFVGKQDSRNNGYSGEIWFANTEKAVKVKEKDIYTNTGEILKFKNNKSYLKITAILDQTSVDYVYGVVGGQLKEMPISGKGMELTLLDNDMLSLNFEASDSSVDGNGYTKKTYYFYYDNSGFHELGGLSVDRASFEKINGAKKILDSIEEKNEIVRDIQFRSDGTFVINFYDAEWQNFYVLNYNNGTVKIDHSKDGEGYYSPAIIPDIAVYPSKDDFKQLVPQ